MKAKKRARISAASREIDKKSNESKVVAYRAILTPTIAFWILIVSVLFMRLALFYTTFDDPYMEFRVGDEAHYHEWAVKILDGQWTRGASFFTTPLYAYFLAFVYFVSDQNLAYVRFLNVIMGLGTVILTYLTARKFLSETASFIAALLLGFSTAPIFYEWFPEKTSLVLFLTALSFYLISRAATTPKAWPWLAAGFAAGLASLGHMLLMVMLPAVLICLVVNRKETPVPALKALAMFAFAFFLGLSPATIHNYLQDRDFVLISSNGGQNFYVSNHTGNYTGEYIGPSFSLANIDNEEKNFKEEAERRTQRTMKPSEVSRFWFKQGWTEILQEPGLALTRFWNRLRWAAGADEPSDTRTYEFYQARYRILKPPFGALVWYPAWGWLGWFYPCGTGAPLY